MDKEKLISEVMVRELTEKAEEVKDKINDTYDILEHAEGWAQATLRNINHWIDASLEDAKIRNMLYDLFGYVNNILEKINMAESKLISLT